jgi:uncharacterized protein (TIGR00304 family)
MTPLLLLGIGVFLLGVFVLILPQKWDSKPKKRDNEMPGWIEYHDEEESFAKGRGGAVIMIGPIPVIIGSDPVAAVLMMIVSLAIMILWMILIRGA